MTACVNRKHTKKVAAVVTASLVGALSLGAAPVAAMADTGVDLLEATPESSAADGSIIKFEGGTDGASFVANGEAQGIVPTLVQPWGTTSEDAQLEVSSYVVYKITNATDKKADQETTRTINGKSFYYDRTFGTDSGKQYNELPTETGTYAVFAKVMINDEEISVTEGATFTIAAATLDGAELYQLNTDDPDDLSDTEFTFNTSSWGIGSDSGNELGLKNGDAALDSEMFTFDYYTAKGAAIDADETVSSGDYYVIVSGNENSPYRGQKQRFDFTVEAYDLAGANIVAADVEWKEQGGGTTSKILTVDGVGFEGSWIEDYVTVDYPDVATKLGNASLTVNVDTAALRAKGWDGSIVNSQVVNYNVVEAIVSPTATYDGKQFRNTDLSVDFSADPTNAFDASKVKVTYKDPKTGETVATDKYTLRVVNTETQEVGDIDMLETPGTYTVQAVLDSEGLSWAVAGKSGVMDVTVTKGQIGDTDIAFSYKGDTVKTVDELTKAGLEYTPGVDVLDDIAVTVKTANGEVPSSDYEVVVTKEIDGEWVEIDSIEGAGEYKVSVVADGYSYVDDESYILVSIAKRDLSDLDIRAKDTFNYTESVWDEDENGYISEEHRVLPYTGEVIEASYEWSVDGKTWYDLPAGDIEVSYKLAGKKADLLKTGKYEASIAATDDSENYAGNKGITVEVSDKKVYSDVANDQWYSQVVYDASDLGYLKGYSGTQLFGPNDDITRGQVACVLFNMAGADKYFNESDFNYSADSGYETGFSDVDGTMYYAKAIAWAKAAGVVNGYAGTDEFRPDAKVTREEFAAMLSNYAEKLGDDVDGAEADLTAFDDASQVSDWATEAIEWAVANEVMGNGGFLNPTGTITRAEVAAMAVNYQPDGAPDTIIK